MKTGLWITAPVLMLALASGPSGCKRRAPLPPGAIAFAGAGVVLVPGQQWKELRSGEIAEEHNVCLPVLEGQGELEGMVIQVYSSPTDRSRPETRAATLRKLIEAQPEAIQDSFTEEKFTAESGLAGVHVSYDVNYEVKGRKIKSRTHVYIVQGARHTTVGVSVTAVASRDLEPIHQMIRKTLRLE